MKKTILLQLAVLLVLAQLLSSDCARAETPPEGSGTAGDPSAIPAMAALPVLSSTSFTVTTTSSPGDPNDVVQGILANDPSKPGTPNLVNDVTRARFAQADVEPVNNAATTSPARRFTDIVWLAALAACGCVVMMSFRKARPRATPAKPPLRESPGGSQNTTKLDHPRPI